MNCQDCRYAKEFKAPQDDREQWCTRTVCQWFTCDCARVTGDCADGRPKKAKPQPEARP